ncbi:MAG: hypothetical protein HY903_12555 [Deltaproteobacteria bacterium]|nr:hypothetical protein [Deltaproteobacteria bacterium]
MSPKDDRPSDRDDTTDEPLANLAGAPEDDDDLDVGARSIRLRIIYVVVGLVLLVLAFVVGHWNETYRGVVLEVKDDRMLLGFARRPPDWVDGVITEPGHVVKKQAWRWDPEPEALGADDEELRALYERYARTYRGTVVEIRAPKQPGKFPVAEIRTDDGERVFVNLVDTVLMGVQINRRVEKVAGTWDPRLVPLAQGVVELLTPAAAGGDPGPRAVDGGP